MTRRAGGHASLVNLTDITEIELLILQRHAASSRSAITAAVAHGAGFDFVGLRDWQAGDRLSAIDWAQSSLTNFSPLVVREFEQPSTATVLAVADASLSTRCGIDGVPIAAAIVARALATIGLSAVFFQDPLRPDHLRRWLHADGRHSGPHRAEPRHPLPGRLRDRAADSSRSPSAAAWGRRWPAACGHASLVPVISDFLFAEAPRLVEELVSVNVTHDVFLVMVDGAFAYAAPPSSAGWITVRDVEGGGARVLSRRAFRQLGEQARAWQAEVAAAARAADLDVVVLGADQAHGEIALAEFVAERRLRKVAR